MEGLFESETVIIITQNCLAPNMYRIHFPPPQLFPLFLSSFWRRRLTQIKFINKFGNT